MSAGVERVKAIDVLHRVDCGDDVAAVDLRWQRQLHQDRMHGVIGVEPRDQGEELGFACGLLKPMVERLHAGCGGHLPLVADIGFACRIVAHHDHVERGDEAMIAGKARDLSRHLGA